MVSAWAERTIEHQTGYRLEQVLQLASVVHQRDDQAAAISSGSFPTRGMAVVPCSMKTLAAIACGFADDLIHRAADVTLKERRRLVLVPREAPLSSIHLENMLKLSNLGAVIPPARAGLLHPPPLPGRRGGARPGPVRVELEPGAPVAGPLTPHSDARDLCP